MAVIWNMSCEICILWARDIKLFFYSISFQDMQSFLISCLSNKLLSYLQVASILREFWMILSPNKFWGKLFFSLVQCFLIED